MMMFFDQRLESRIAFWVDYGRNLQFADVGGVGFRLKSIYCHA